MAPRFHRICTSTSFSLIPLKLSPMDETQRSSYSRFFSSYRLGSGGDFGHMLYVLSRGGTIFFPGASTIETLQTLELYKVQGLIASPGWLSVFLKHYDDSTDFRSGFEVILSTGSALSASLSQRVRARLCSNLIFYYGTTETSTDFIRAGLCPVRGRRRVYRPGGYGPRDRQRGENTRTRQ